MTPEPLRIRFLLREVDERRAHLDLELLSVSMTRGVIPRSALTDDEPRADDLGNYKVCHPGDIVVNRMSAYQGALGMADQDGIVSPDYIVFRPSAIAWPRWLHHLMRSSWFVSEMSARIRGIGSIGTGNVRTPRVSASEIGEIKVVVPNLTTQRAIADYLDVETARIDALIAKKQRMLALLADQLDSRITFHMDDAIDEWGEVPLKRVATVEVSSIDKKSYEGEEPVLLCNYTDVYYNRRIDGQIAFMAATAGLRQVIRFTLRRGDVVITKDSETVEDIAVPALVTEDLPGVVLGYHLALLRPRIHEGAFLYWAVRSRRCRNAFSLAASGVTRVGLRSDAVGRVPVPNAPFASQATIIEALERAAGESESVSRMITRQIELLRERRQALITAVVTGEMSVPGVAA